MEIDKIDVKYEVITEGIVDLIKPTSDMINEKKFVVSYFDLDACTCTGNC